MNPSNTNVDFTYDNNFKQFKTKVYMLLTAVYMENQQLLNT